MKFLKNCFKDLQEYKYFDMNINLVYDTSDICVDSLRKFRAFTENAGVSYKSYLNSFLELKRLYSIDKDFRDDYIKLVYRYHDSCIKHKSADDIIVYSKLIIILYSVCVDNGGVVISTKNTSYVARVLDNIMDINKNFSDFVNLLQERLSYIPSTSEIDNKLFRTTRESVIFPVTINVLYSILSNIVTPELFNNDTDNLFVTTLKAQYLSTKLLCQSVKFKATNLNKISQIQLSISSSSNKVTDLVQASNEVKKLADKKDIQSSKTHNYLASFKRIDDRKGFLLEEYKTGRLEHYNPAKDFINFDFTELVTDDRVIILYTIWDDDFLVTVREDSLTEEIIGKIMFMDESDVMDKNTNETNILTLQILYLAARMIYLERISNEKYVASKVTVYPELCTKKTREKLKLNNVYSKIITIPPYARKLPKGQKRGIGKKEKALQVYGITLKDDETLVNLFEKVVKCNVDENHYKGQVVKEIKTNPIKFCN